MAKRTCGACGARFEGDDAVELFAAHIESFHPPTPIPGGAKSSVKGGKAEPADEPEPSSSGEAGTPPDA